MTKKLTIAERTKLEKEIYDIMMNIDQNDTIEESKNDYERAGEILVALNLLNPAHQNIPEVVVRVYMYHLANKIKKITGKSRKKMR